MDMNDMILNKNDELKYLILMREEFYKYKLKIYFFRKWKSRALYNHDLLDEDDPFQNNDVENYQNFKNMNNIQQGIFNSKNSNDGSGKNSINNIQSRIGNNPNLLIFDDEENNNKNKNNEIKLEDSIKVLDVQKNINNALYNTNDVFSKYNIINSNNNKASNNERYNNILHSIERLKNNVTYGENMTNNKLDNNENITNNFNDLLIKNNDEDNDINITENQKNLMAMRDKKNILSKQNQNNLSTEENKKNLLAMRDKKNILSTQNQNNLSLAEKKNNLLAMRNQKKYGKSKNYKSDDSKNNEKDKDKSKSKKKFDIKNSYRYKPKDNIQDDEERYKNIRYISTKYKDYLHTGEKLLNTKKSSSKQKNKLNNLYQEIQKNLEHDETLLRRLELKRDISNQNIKEKKSRSKSKNKMDKSVDKIKNITDNNNNININKKQRYFMNYDNTKNFEENLIKNGFFSGKNKKNENIENEDSNEDTYPQNIREIVEKYKKNKDNSKEKKKEKNYDYIKKIKASEQGQGFFIGNKSNPYYKNNIKYKNNDDDYDEEYDEIFHPKNIRKTNINNYYQENTSDYSNSVYNIINNLDGYDNLITDINEPKYNRINKRRIVRNPKRAIKERKSALNYDFIENSRSNNTSFILAPMKSVPITNISFRARMKYFSDKKQKNLEKLLKAKKEEEKQIYTFQPKTGENRLNVIKYDNYINNDNKTNNKRMPDYNRINNLYLDYKEKKNKLDDLTREYYKKAGISFTPLINDKNKEIKEFKNKIGQIPYLDRIDIYNACKQNYRNDNNLNFFPTEIY